MENASIATPPSGGVPAGSGAGDKGLRMGADQLSYRRPALRGTLAPGSTAATCHRT